MIKKTLTFFFVVLFGGIAAAACSFTAALLLRCVLRAWRAGWTLFALAFLLAASHPSHGTDVLFPVKSMYLDKAWSLPFTITARTNLLTDGTNFIAALPRTVTPAGTNPIIKLRPNAYDVFFPDLRRTITIRVFDTNVVVSALDLMTNTLPTFVYQPPFAAGSATNLIGNAITQVKSLILNAYMGTNTAFVLVRTNGDDGTGTIGNTNYPFATITNAIASRTNLYVDVGPGTFAVTNLNLRNGISLVGKGTDRTFLTIDSSAAQNSGLVIAGNNVYLQDFTIGTNVNAGFYYFPISVGAGISNLVAANINVIGNSDGVFAVNLSAKSVGEFYYCNFSSGFDCIQLSSALTGASTNSLFSFYGCRFSSVLDTNFVGQDASCISVSAAQIYAKDCSFTSSNRIAGVYGIIGYYSNSGITVENNTYSMAGLSGMAVSATGSLWIRGTVDVANFSGNSSRSWVDFLLPNGALRRRPLY